MAADGVNGHVCGCCLAGHTGLWPLIAWTDWSVTADWLNGAGSGRVRETIRCGMDLGHITVAAANMFCSYDNGIIIPKRVGEAKYLIQTKIRTGQFTCHEIVRRFIFVFFCRASGS